MVETLQSPGRLFLKEGSILSRQGAAGNVHSPTLFFEEKQAGRVEDRRKEGDLSPGRTSKGEVPLPSLRLPAALQTKYSRLG
jgi:hypothetical protein